MDKRPSYFRNDAYYATRPVEQVSLRHDPGQFLRHKLAELGAGGRRFLPGKLAAKEHADL